MMKMTEMDAAESTSVSDLPDEETVSLLVLAVI
jgi:hypothetical protein